MTVSDLLISAPLLILAIGAIITLLSGPLSSGKAPQVVAVITALAATVAALLLQSYSVSSFGTAWTPLCRSFTILFTLLAAAVLLISGRYNRYRGITGEEYPATVLFATFGMAALASATNLLILFMGLEAMTFGFYILVAIDLKSSLSGEAGLKYLLLGALSAAFLAFGIALLYFSSGSLLIAEGVRIGAGDPLALCGWGFILIGAAFKLSLVPVHLWTPDIYQGAPVPVVAFLSGASKSASILFAFMLLSVPGNAASLRMPLLALALLSMVLGNLAALLQKSIRRMLAYSSIAQMGYVTLALLSGHSGGFRAALYYAIVYAIITLTAFGAVAIFERSGCTDQIEDYCGGGAQQPFAAAILSLAMFALAGIPPTAGFTGKFMIFTSALRGGELTIAVIGILTAAASAFYYLRVVANLYMRRSERGSYLESCLPEKLILSAAAILILIAGLFPSLLLNGMP